MIFLSLKRTGNLMLLLCSVFLVQACSKQDISGFDSSVTANEPDQFLLFFNRQSSLPAGKYTIIAATANTGLSGSFSLQIQRNDGTPGEVISGQWTNSAGPSATPLATCSGSPANACFELDMQQASGVSIELSSTLNSVLYLVDDSSNAVILSEQNIQSAGQNETIKFVESNINQLEYARAYYAAVDPLNARDTLQKFKSLHGFDSAGADEHVIFRDSKDLGYGRDMFMRNYPNIECGGFVTAFYVRNFSVEIVDGFAYGPVNLAAAVTQDLQHHFGTNAIEFSRGLTSAGDTCSPVPFTRFYTYQSDYSSANAPHPRLLTVDLDGRGEKAIPQPCIVCHGGKLRPLDRLGRFVAKHANDSALQIGDTKARLQAFEVDTFEFSDSDGFTRADFEEGLRNMNRAVFCSYPGSLGHAACDDMGGGIEAQADNGEWNADFAREVLQGWYQNQLEVSGSVFSEEFVPSGWIPAPGGAPEGADTLFTKVIGPNCFVCHGKRGNALGSEINISGQGKDLDFSSWEKFISYADEIRELVFEEGRMPLGLLNFNNFWLDKEKAQLLASFIAPHVSVDFASLHVGSNGKIIPPGKVLAKAGPDRVTQANAAITLSANGSFFADQYSWEIISAPSGANASLMQADKGTTRFSADMDGLYELQLTARLSSGNDQSSDTLLVRVDSNLPKAPTDLNFYTDIVPNLSDCATTCHSTGGGTAPAEGVSVWWVDDTLQPLGIPIASTDTPSLGLYEQIIARVNLQAIDKSLVLQKPSNNHHYGNLRPGFDTSLEVGASGRAIYDLYVNWISEGVVCGGTATQCP